MLQGWADKAPCKFRSKKFHKRLYPPNYIRRFAMKKFSVKQLLVKAMEQYGSDLILADRFWSPFRLKETTNTTRVSAQPIWEVMIYEEQQQHEAAYHRSHGHLRRDHQLAERLRLHLFSEVTDYEEQQHEAAHHRRYGRLRWNHQPSGPVSTGNPI